MRHLALLLLATGCGEATFYDIDVQGVVTDLDGAPIIDQLYSLCGTATFNNGEVVDGECDSGTTTDLGDVAMSFSTTTTARLVSVTTTLTIADTEMVHQATDNRSIPSDVLTTGLDVFVQGTYSMDRTLLPQRTTRFDVSGFVSSIDDVANRIGTLTVSSSIEPGTAPDFEGSSSVTTDERGDYRVDVDLVSDWDFPISSDRLRLVLTLDGQSLEGAFDILDAESGEPRTVDIIATF